ncbi:sulfate ABC transporter permease subunit [Heliophilum fasciatum]|uniref:Sulfate transport system permease protein n=1 Tax=Heliophilum fasciatum TaxID=35700 RepID=A0A4R2S0L9_9FIRM|nr:sulfate ABC transporter permease subunit [Heliophilum fasciatum]MCW2276802.1 sulfate transport system permease protein [Heliophilum fasciatum]TCP68737.1 sulfate transport system permease protein [Heliophilum fasciatum]
MNWRIGISSFTYAWFLLSLLGPIGALLASAVDEGASRLWAELFRPEALFALKLTLLITVIVVVINTVLGILTALLIVRHPFPGVTVLNTIVDLPFAVSPIIAGFMLVLLYGPNSLIGGFAGEMGYKIIFALPGMIVATLFVTFPFMVREVVPALQEVGTYQEQAAQTLGASPWTIFWKVTLPSIRGSVFYGIVLTVARSLGEFGAVLVVSGNLINQTQSATLYVYQAAADFNSAGAYALSLLLCATSIVILVLMESMKKYQEGRQA